jgi:Domain of unknown function (DUF4145)
MEVHLSRGAIGTITAREVSMRCPLCRHEATLDPLHNDFALDRIGGTVIIWGSRRCPKADCGALIQVIIDGDRVYGHPPEMIDFDATDLPETVLAPFEEAIKCHAHGCYVASAIMVRKTLEEICADRGAQGNSLRARLESLQGKLLLPKEMFDALHDLRLLGNDAAHVELSDFDAIDAAKTEAAIDIGKEILKAAYQYKTLMGKLDALKAQR